MQVRPQRIVGEVLFPQPGREEVNVGGGVQLLPGPVEEGVHHRLGMGEAVVALGLAGEVLFSDASLARVQLTDAREGR